MDNLVEYKPKIMDRISKRFDMSRINKNNYEKVIKKIISNPSLLISDFDEIVNKIGAEKIFDRVCYVTNDNIHRYFLDNIGNYSAEFSKKILERMDSNLVIEKFEELKDIICSDEKLLFRYWRAIPQKEKIENFGEIKKIVFKDIKKIGMYWGSIPKEMKIENYEEVYEFIQKFPDKIINDFLWKNMDEITQIELTKRKPEIFRKMLNDANQKTKNSNVDFLDYVGTIVNETPDTVIDSYYNDIIDLKGFTIEQKDFINKLYKKNTDIIKNYAALDYLVKGKYMNSSLGIDKLNLLFSYNDISTDFIRLTDDVNFKRAVKKEDNQLEENKELLNKRLKIFEKCIARYEDKNVTEEWTVIADLLIHNLPDYDELIKNFELDSLSNDDIDKFISMVIKGKFVEINNYEQFQNYDKLKEQKCDEYINSNSIVERRNAIFEKVYGISLEDARDFANKFSTCIDKINDEDLKNFIKSLDNILKIDEMDALKEIYDSCGKVPDCDSLSLKKKIRSEFADLYNDILFKPENEIEEYEYKDSEGNNRIITNKNMKIYDAGTDFNMLVTSIGAYFDNGNAEMNFERAWNISKIKSRHMCTSFIRNDMIGTAEIPYLCFGFSNMDRDSLLMSGPDDISSYVTKFVPGSYFDEKYYDPDTQIGKTTRYNEMCYRRIQNGEKKQPDYLVAFKREGQIPNMEYIEQAVEDFKKTGRDIPVVFVDVDRCLKKQREEYDRLKKIYFENHDVEIGKKLNQIVSNNRVTSSDFCIDDSLLYLMEIDDKVNLENNKLNIVNVNEEISLLKSYNNKSIDEETIDKVKTNVTSTMEKMKNINVDISKISEVTKNSLVFAELLGIRLNLSENDMEILRKSTMYLYTGHERKENRFGIYSAEICRNNEEQSSNTKIMEYAVATVANTVPFFSDKDSEYYLKDYGVKFKDRKRAIKIAKILMDVYNLENNKPGNLIDASVIGWDNRKLYSGANEMIDVANYINEEKAKSKIREFELAHPDLDCSTLYDQEYWKKEYGRYVMGGTFSWIVENCMNKVDLPKKTKFNENDLAEISSNISNEDKKECLEIIKEDIMIESHKSVNEKVNNIRKKINQRDEVEDDYGER